MNSNVLHLSRDGFSVTSTLDTVVCIGICLSSVWSAGPIPGGVQKLWSSKSKTYRVFCVRYNKVLEGTVISKDIYCFRISIDQKQKIRIDAFNVNKKFVTNHFSGEAWTR